MREVIRFLPLGKRYDDMSPGKLVCVAQIEKLSNKKSAAKASTHKKSLKLYHGSGR